MILSSVVCIIAAAASLASATTTWSENLVLADCGIGRLPNGGSTSRQMMYYDGPAWGTPKWMAEVPWDGSYPWRNGGVAQTLPNGDKWTVFVNNNVGDPKLAGFAIHTYDSVPLMCWSRHIDGLYTLDDGTPCSMAYICNHEKPTPPEPAPKPPAEPEQRFSYNIRDETVELVGHHHPVNVLDHVQWSGSGATYCADKWFPILGSAKFDKPSLPDCEIKFSCGPNNAQMMLEVAKQVANKADGLWRQETQHLDRCPIHNVCINPQACYSVCQQGPDCACDDEHRERAVTIAPSHVIVDKVGDGQSRFEYWIQCPDPQKTKSCAVCNAAKLVSLPLDLITFGIASAAVSATCSFDGC